MRGRPPRSGPAAYCPGLSDMVALAVWLVSAVIVGLAAIVAFYAAVAIVAVPVLLLAVLCTPFVLLGDALRDARNVRDRQRQAKGPRPAVSAPLLARRRYTAPRVPLQ
jgi:hypothetical protein